MSIDKFNKKIYLECNDDIKDAVEAKIWESAYDHFKVDGLNQPRVFSMRLLLIKSIEDIKKIKEKNIQLEELLRKKEKEFEGEIGKIQLTNLKISQELHEIKNSKSWKITSFLRLCRFISGKIKKIGLIKISKKILKIYKINGLNGVKSKFLQQYYLVLNGKEHDDKTYIGKDVSIKNEAVDHNFYEEQLDFSSDINRNIKILSYYLPQFHRTDENDLWHGEGFTEWTNSSSAKKQFLGHYQPHIPHSSIGEYVLDNVNVLKKQAEMMEKSGVYGQIFYHYWFSGRLILEKPALLLLKNLDVKMPFCFCWANENWTKKWDGNDEDILLEQVYSPNDAENFIRYLIPFFKDHRYIKLNERPVLFIYRAESIKNIKNYLEIWKNICAENNIKNPYIVSTATRGAKSPKIYGVDAECERVLHDWTDGAIASEVGQLEVVEDFDGSVLDYQKVAHFYKSKTETYDYPRIRSIVPNWDNTARYGSKAYALHKSNPEVFQYWLEELITQANNSKKDEVNNFIIVNAWNEWAEGAHLEPDIRNGYSYLNSVGRALSNIVYPGLPRSSKKNQLENSISIFIKLNPIVAEQLSRDANLFAKFSSCIQLNLKENFLINISDSIFNNSAKLLNNNITNSNADIIVEINEICIFDGNFISKFVEAINFNENNLYTSVEYGNDSENYTLPENDNVKYYPVNLQKKKFIVAAYRNQLNIESAPKLTVLNSTIFSAEINPLNNAPEIEVIIRFHKNNSLEILSLCLLSLASSSCKVIPSLCIQDVSIETNIKISNLLDSYYSITGLKGKLKNYISANGNGDLRSLMLNDGFIRSESKYCAFLDYDDRIFSGSYMKMINRLNSTNKSITFGRVYSAEANRFGVIKSRTKSFDHGSTYQDFLNNNFIPIHSAVFVRSNINADEIFYDQNQKYMEDYLFLLNVLNLDNADWASCADNFYIGDYFHYLGSESTLGKALHCNVFKDEILNDEEHIKCQYIVDKFRGPLIDKFRNYISHAQA